MPVSLSILYRELHDEKEFQDFHDAWMPPVENTKPFNIGDTTYHHYAPFKTRVINAINVENPKEIISVCLTWCSEQELEQAIKELTPSKANSQRHDSIATVAEKISSKFYPHLCP